MRILFILFALLNSLLVSAAKISVEVDRNPVSFGDSFQLTFTATEAPNSTPDFKPLTQDFEIINQSHTNQASWVNGNRTASIKWTLQLMSKRTGSISIPGVNFGTDKTEPLTITVTDAPPSNDLNSQEEIFLKVEAAPRNPYVQSQILYTMRLYRRVNIAQARLDEPKLPEAVVQKLGEDTTYNTQVNGVDYAVTERKFAIFPQKSGSFTIAPLTLMAQIATDAFPQFNGFFNQQASQTKKIISNAIPLDVRPAPVPAQMANWLPAEDLQIKQEWSGNTAQLKIGEPITRTLTVVAKGATVGLLPELFNRPSDVQLKTYPDQPTLKEMAKEDGIYAMREEKIAIIPGNAGDFTLPAIEIPWFNIKTEKLEVAKLPAVTLKVLGNAQNTAPTPPPATIVKPASPATSSTQPVAPETSSPASNDFLHNRWVWLCGFLALGWIVTLLYFITKKQSAPTDSRPATQTTPVNERYATSLKQACSSNDPQQVKAILLQWGQAEYNVNSLGELAEHCDARLRDEIMQLNQLLYAPVNSLPDWQGKRLFQMFTEQMAAKKVKSGAKVEPLEPLYKL